MPISPVAMRRSKRRAGEWAEDYIREMIPQSKSLENESRRPLSRRSRISLIYEGKSSGRSISQDPVKSKSAVLMVCSCTVIPVILSPIKWDNRPCR